MILINGCISPKTTDDTQFKKTPFPATQISDNDIMPQQLPTANPVKLSTCPLECCVGYTHLEKNCPENEYCINNTCSSEINCYKKGNTFFCETDLLSLDVPADLNKQAKNVFLAEYKDVLNYKQKYPIFLNKAPEIHFVKEMPSDCKKRGCAYENQGYWEVSVLSEIREDGTPSHETIHALLDSLNLPIWIEEGLNKEIENSLLQRNLLERFLFDTIICSSDEDNWINSNEKWDDLKETVGLKENLDSCKGFFLIQTAKAIEGVDFWEHFLQKAKEEGINFNQADKPFFYYLIKTSKTSLIEEKLNQAGLGQFESKENLLPTIISCGADFDFEHDEITKIAIDLQNIGNEPIYDINISATASDEDKPYKNNEFVSEIKANESKQVELILDTKFGKPTDVNITITSSASKPLVFQRSC